MLVDRAQRSIVSSSAQGQMVEDGVVDRRKLDAIPLFASSRWRSHAQEANHDIMDVRPSRHPLMPVFQIAAQQPFDGNPRTGRCLPSDGDVGFRDDYIAVNDSRYIEDHNARSPRLASRIQTPRT